MTDDPKHALPCELVDAVALDELARLCDVEPDWIVELVMEGILEPKSGDAFSWRFSSISITRTQVASRLRQQLGVNNAGIAIALDLLDERKQLYQKLHLLEVIGENEGE